MKFRHLLPFILLWASLPVASAQTGNLPVINIEGKNYYCYEVKNGDSLYGIAHQLGWDSQILKQMNPTVKGELKKGMRVFYPADNKVKHAEQADKTENTTGELTHVVKKGENIYSIAKQYDVPTDIIYHNNPFAANGVKAGDVLTILPDDGKEALVIYVIAHGDTPYSVAKKFHSSVEDIYRENPGTSDNNFKAGSKIRVLANSDLRRIQTEKVTEQQLSNFVRYKVGSNESWEGIARKLNTEASELRSINPQVQTLKKGTVLYVPEYKTTEITREYIAEDPRERTAEGRAEIFEDVRQSLVNEPDRVKIAIVLDTPSAKKDLEFTRGFLTCVDKYGDSGIKIDIDVINGTESHLSIKERLDSLRPNYIISTADKDFPVYLVDYAAENYAKVLNPFDLKSDLYLTKPSMVQLMPPTSDFNASAMRFIENNFGDRKFIYVVGENEEDLLGSDLSGRIDTSRMLQLTPEEAKDYPFYETEKYIVYIGATKRNEVSSILDIINNAKSESPFTEIAVIGKPSWLTLTNTLKDKMFTADVYIPSRFYFDTDAPESKEFIADYKTLFSHPPLKSYPVYAAVGYDVANCFISSAKQNKELISTPAPKYPFLQYGFDIKPAGGNGGYINPVSFMIHLTPYQTIEKITIE